jgi:hypothetical protein
MRTKVIARIVHGDDRHGKPISAPGLGFDVGALSSVLVQQFSQEVDVLCEAVFADVFVRP